MLQRLPDVAEHFTSRGKIRELKTVLTEGETDVMGINEAQKAIYMAEVAFHSAQGLHYKDNEKAVTKKLLRSYLNCLAYFPEETYSYEIIFASPSVQKKDKVALEKIEKQLNCFFADKKFPKVRFLLILDETFESEIIKNVLPFADSADESETFLRSVKLLHCANYVV